MEKQDEYTVVVYGPFGPYNKVLFKKMIGKKLSPIARFFSRAPGIIAILVFFAAAAIVISYNEIKYKSKV